LLLFRATWLRRGLERPHDRGEAETADDPARDVCESFRATYVSHAESMGAGVAVCGDR
jgi:hypothetical protein